jgi:hypothetical protein
MIPGILSDFAVFQKKTNEMLAKANASLKPVYSSDFESDYHASEHNKSRVF